MSLVITRRVGEVLKIDDDIEIIVSRITRGQVKLVINAPKERKVWRGEIYERLVHDEQGGNR